MKKLHKNISILDLVECLSTAMDFISQTMCNHQRRVGYIAMKIAEEISLPVTDQKNVLIAGFLHDCGALSLAERQSATNFELSENFNFLHKHAEAGYELLRKFLPFHDIAHFVRFHHYPWKDGKGQTYKSEEVHICSHIIHLADRIDILIDNQKSILIQVPNITKKINNMSGTLFSPLLVEAFNSIAQKESFWLDIENINTENLWGSYSEFGHIKGDNDSLLSMTNLFSHIIDFRSRFTATHSSGVSACAVFLAHILGMDEYECLMMKIAGNLHDLGKLAVPREILEKPDKLTKYEFSIIRAHTYYTYKTLQKFRDFDQISNWAANHHERLDGKGYPFHYREKELSLGCKIMAVADVFTAITENRPYRKGMDNRKAIDTLYKMVKNNALDGDIVSTLVNNFYYINEIRIEEQNKALAEYQKFENYLASI